MNGIMNVKSRRDEYTEATRQALLSAGREAFARDGYQAAGIETISRAARVTRGAFYHHFEDKTALFDAVVASMQAGAAAKIKEKAKAKARQNVGLWDRLIAGIDTYLDVCLEPAYGRIVVQDAPAVLGNARFRELEEAYPMALLATSLETLKRNGELDFEDIGLLSRMIDAMICKVAVMLPDATDPKKLREHGLQIIGSLLAAFRRT
jgi:AcrR family transcriptional regulator